MTQDTVANMMRKKAIDLSSKWSDHYGRASVDGRLMSEDLFVFTTTLINMIEGFEGTEERATAKLTEADNEISELKQERDEALDQMVAHRDGHNKFRRMWEKDHNILQAIETMTKLK